MSFSPLVRDLRLRLGTENVLSAPSELAVYDCDALTHRAPIGPEAVVFPRSTPQTVAVMASLPSARHGGDRPRRRHRAGRRLHGPSRRRGAVAGADEPRAGDRSPRPHGGGRAGRRPTCSFPAPWPAAATTSPPILPAKALHHRRQRGHQCRRAATLRYGVTVSHLLGLEAVLSSGAVLQLGPVGRPGHAGPGRRALRQRRHARRGHQDLAPPHARSAGRSHRPGGLQHASTTPSAAVTQIIAAGIIPTAMELWTRGSWRRSKRHSTSAFRPMPPPCW